MSIIKLKESRSKTRIENLELKPRSLEKLLDESLKLKVSYRIVGELRDALNQERIEEAYKAHDVVFRLTSTVNLIKRTAPFIYRRVRTIKLVRKAIFYWSRDSNVESRIRVMVVDENTNPSIVEDMVQLNEKLFNYTIQLTLLASDLGVGEHKLAAKVRVKWGSHTFINKGKAESTSEKLKILIKPASH
ncbi:MAG: hypothetical protein QXJ86_05155 [Nitrososphaerales archaeon]